MAKIDPTKPKKIQISKKRIPLVKLLNGKEIRDAAAALEGYRMKMNEQEFLYGATLKIKYDTWSRDFDLVAERMETGEEVGKRLAKAAAAAEARRIREAAKKVKEEEAQRQRREARLDNAIREFQKEAHSMGMTVEQMLDRLAHKVV